MKNLSVLGSTGSIGRSALDVVEAFPGEFRVVALAAGRSVEKLAEQIARHRPDLVSVASSEDARRLQALLPAGVGTRIVTGPEGLEETASYEKADVVVGGLVGALGLRSAYAAAVAGKRLAQAVFPPFFADQLDFGAREVWFGRDDRKIWHKGLLRDGLGRGVLDEQGVSAGCPVSTCQPKPGGGIALRIEVNQKDTFPVRRQSGGEVNCRCRLAHAAFLVRDC